jgi:HSP20 family protein
MKTTLPSRVSNRLSTWFRPDPFGSLRDEVNDLFNRFSGEFDGELAELPSMDLAETDSQIEVKMDVPGYKPDEIDVEVQGNTLVVTGERKEEKEEKGKTFHQIERRTRSINRSVTLPCAVEVAKINAECKDGVLAVTLPKTEKTNTRKIPVKG